MAATDWSCSRCDSFGRINPDETPRCAVSERVMTGILDLFRSLDGRDRYEYALACRVVTASEAQREREKRNIARRCALFAVGALTIGKHGTAAYRCGCRCDTCRQANTDYSREYQRRRAKDPAFVAKRRAYDAKKRAKKKAVAA